MKIDIFTHVMPQSYIDRFMAKLGPDFYLGNLPKLIPEMVDMSHRIALMDDLGIDKQVVCLATPPIEEAIDDPAEAADMARCANDGIADLVAQNSERFVGIGTIAMNNMAVAVDEARRCIEQLGMRGMLLYSNARGQAIDHDEFMPFYEYMEQVDLPILLHPARTPEYADYVDETSSRYAMWQIFGWPYETSMAMTRLIFAGVFDRYPGVKFITHHAGAMIPFFDKRIEYVYPLFDKMGALGDALERLEKPLIEYYRMFYNDTAVMGSVGGMTAAYAFFGADKLLFGTDTPFDTLGGRRFTEETVFSIEALPITPAEKTRIFSGNALSMLHLDQGLSAARGR